MASLVAGTLFAPETRRPTARSARRIRVTRLGRDVFLRPRSRDILALQFVFSEGLHLPPPELTAPIERIAVFGANIGLPMADLAQRCPTAQLLGVEPDADNARLARANLEAVADRATVVEAAVWHSAGRIRLGWEPDAWGLTATPEETPAPGDAAGAEPMTVVDAVSASDVVARFAGEGLIDYLLVNIEGGWRELLAHNTGWAASVRCLKVEVQDDYDDAIAVLARLGFETRLERLPWGAFAIGYRPPA